MIMMITVMACPSQYQRCIYGDIAVTHIYTTIEQDKRPRRVKEREKSSTARRTNKGKTLLLKLSSNPYPFH